MDILFLHGNYPAQFRHLAPWLGQTANQRVVFLTAREDAATSPLPGVRVQTYRCHRQPSGGTHHYLRSSEEAVLQGQAALRAVDALLLEGFRPRVVIYHAGVGLGMFLKDLLPQALHVGYFEWFFQPETARHLLPSFELDVQLLIGMRNLPILYELEACDVGVVPTAWQKSQFPRAYQAKLEVIFDGIETGFFQPEPQGSDLREQALTISNRETGEAFLIPAGAPVLSYATRGMETLRGFPEFLRCAATLLAEMPELRVVVAGADRRAYSYDAPSHGGSWKEHVLAELGAFPGRERLLFTGLLTYPDYRALLWRSSLHCYFTRPYVTSWSLFEAAACGARLAVNLSAATEGIADPTTVRWVNLEDHANLTASIREGLHTPGPRAVLRSGYELSTSLRSWEQLLNSKLQSS